jgi:hypothetical protein
MKKNMLLWLIIPIISVHAQSPWTQVDKGFYGQLSLNMVSGYNELYVTGGNKIATERKIDDLTLQGWLEWGLSESSTILLSLPLKILNAGELNIAGQADQLTQSGSMMALGNIRLGWKQAISTGAYISAWQLWMETPSGKYDDKTGLRSGYDAWTLIPSFSLGTSGSDWYSYGSFAYGLRSNNYSHFLQFNAEVGYHMMPALSIAFYIDWLNSMQNGGWEDPVNNLLTGLYVNDQEYFAFGIKVYGKIISNRLGLSLGLAGAFSGNFVPRVPAFNLALYYK